MSVVTFTELNLPLKNDLTGDSNGSIALSPTNKVRFKGTDGLIKELSLITDIAAVIAIATPTSSKFSFLDVI
jgi:hypothetical protein